MTFPKSVAIEPLLYNKVTLMFTAADIEQINVQLTTVVETVKLKQYPVQSQPTHRKCKGDRTSGTCATNMKQISIWLANKAGNK